MALSFDLYKGFVVIVSVVGAAVTTSTAPPSINSLLMWMHGVFTISYLSTVTVSVGKGLSTSSGVVLKCSTASNPGGALPFELLM